MSRVHFPWLLLLPLTLLTVGCGINDLIKNDTYATPVELSESARYLDGLMLDNDNGDIVITTQSRNSIDIHAEKYVTASSREDARDFIDDVEIRTYVESGRLHVETDLPRRKPGAIGEIGVDYEIRLPSRMDIELSSMNGNVVIVGVEGQIDTATTNGDISLDKVQGTIEARNVNGDIRVKQADGSVSVDSTNGEVFVELISREVHCDARTNNGDITLYIPHDASAEGTLRTVNGSIRSDFALESPAIGGRFRVRLGGGDGQLEAWTNNGDIELRSLGRSSTESRRTR